MATAIDVTLVNNRPVKIPTTTHGPLHSSHYKLGALLVGRSSSGLKGILVLPGIIDADFTGIVQIVAYTLYPPLFIPSGSKIAQLVPLANLTQQITGETQIFQPLRSNSGFGSTGDIVCLTLNMSQWPVTTVTLSSSSDTLRLKALLDTGADVTIVSIRVWPSHWPMKPSLSGVDGIGGTSTAMVSAQPVKISSEKRTATLSVMILPLPDGVNMLIGRECMTQWGVILTTPDTVVWQRPLHGSPPP